MAKGLSYQDVLKLDAKLKFFCWPSYTNYQESDLTKLEDTKNFNEDTYDEAVAIYIYWKKSILPSIEMGEQENYHHCLGQQVYNILHLFAPNHHIHLALRH